MHRFHAIFVIEKRCRGLIIFKSSPLCTDLAANIAGKINLQLLQKLKPEVTKFEGACNCPQRILISQADICNIGEMPLIEANFSIKIGF